MARRDNSLYIGSEHLNIEGRAIKHPALIKLYASLNSNKIVDTPMKLISFDIESDYKSGEMKLLGVWTENEYHYYTKDFISVLYGLVKSAIRKECKLSHWSRFDPFQLFRIMLEMKSKDEQYKSMARYSKTSGEWNRKSGTWFENNPPVIELELGDVRFGIKNAIRSSIQFFYYRVGDENIKSVWSYDIATLYHDGLEKEANRRFDYYSKVDESAHLVDWDRFDKDEYYRNEIVLKSNMLDCRACHDLGLSILKDFSEAFYNYYPVNLISQGSLARSAIFATTMGHYESMYDKEKATEKTIEDIKSLSIISHLDAWSKVNSEDEIKDFYALTCESYSGGQIEAIRVGKSPKAFYADIASAYPATIKELFDLRGSELITGKGEPPRIPNSYVFIRGTVDIPLEVDYHPITVKHPIFLDTNIRPTGIFKASYTLQERDFVTDLGGTFTDETWYAVVTKGDLSPLARACNVFLDTRHKLKAQGKSSEYMAKIAVNSIYGITYEAIDTYIESHDGIVRDGYRAGEFWNPIYASIITSNARIMLCKACKSIEANGGKPVLLMTDSVFWMGKASDLDSSLWREKKTTGYFEKPTEVKNLVCLGTGRYSYEDDKGVVTAKRRGLNSVEMLDPDGILLDDVFSWSHAIDLAVKSKKPTIEVKVRVLISTGVILHNHSFTTSDLSRIIDDVREVELIVGKTKRIFPDIRTSDLRQKMIKTDSLYLGVGMDNTEDINDQTLAELRSMMMKNPYKSKNTNVRKSWNRASSKYYDKKKDAIRENYKKSYQMLKEYGYDSQACKKMANWNVERIHSQLKDDNKI